MRAETYRRQTNCKAGAVFAALAFAICTACSSPAVPAEDAATTPDAPTVDAAQDIPDDPALPGIANIGGDPFDLMRPDLFVYNQRDPVWVDQPLGGTDESVGDYGCTLTSLAMAVSNLGQEVDPGTLNVLLTENGGFTRRGWLVWGAVPAATSGAVAVEYYDAPRHADIDACMTDKGGYPLVRFMLRGQVQHWALVLGKTGNTYLIRDPLKTTRAPIRLQTRAPRILSVRCVRPN